MKEIIESLNLKYNEEKINTEQIISECWNETAGGKIRKFAKFYGFSDKNILTVVCENSFVSNELFNSKSELLKILNEKLKASNIEIRDIIFDYKKWENKNNEA